MLEGPPPGGGVPRPLGGEGRGLEKGARGPPEAFGRPQSAIML